MSPPASVASGALPIPSVAGREPGMDHRHAPSILDRFSQLGTGDLQLLVGL
jgi:hypothetical protein